MNREKYVCKVCGKSFRSGSGLRIHMKTEHAGRYYGFRVGIPVLALIMIIVFIGLTIGFPLGGQQTHTTTLTTQQTTLSTPKQTSVKKAPEFSLPVYDILSSTERYISLSDFSGKPVLLEFFSPNCGHCIKMIPTIEELSKRYGGEMVFLVISTPMREQLKNVIEKYGLTQTILIDDKYEVFNKYDVEGTPTFIILDSSHNIVKVIIGERPIEEFTTAIERAIG